MKSLLYELIHTFIAVVCVVLFSYWGLALLGASIATAFFLGREHAQAEYRWIEHYGDGRRANMKWHNAFESRVWNIHSWFWNLTLPAVVSFVVALTVV